MAAAKSSKSKAALKKRKARDADRAHAAELVRRYREKDPYVLVCSNGVITSPVDGDVLAAALETFANHGTWEMPAEWITASAISKRNFLRGHVLKLREQQGMTYDAAMRAVSERYKVSFDAVKDAVYPRTSKTRKT